VSNMKGVGKKNTLVHHKHVAGRPHYLIKTPTEYFFFFCLSGDISYAPHVNMMFKQVFYFV